MGIFIKAEINRDKCIGINDCGKCVQVCPVNVFEKNGEIPSTMEENEDECTLCDLCIKACEPDAVTIIKLYE